MFKKTIAAIVDLAVSSEPILNNIRVSRSTAAINARTDALIALQAELEEKQAARRAAASN